MSYDVWKRIATSVISGAILLALTAFGQIAYVHFEVKEHTEDIRSLQENTVKKDVFMRYLQLLEERNMRLENGMERNAKANEELRQKMSKELSKIRDALGYSYRGGNA